MTGFSVFTIIILKEGRPGGGNRMEVMDITEKERMDTKMATLYELRLIITSGEKKVG